MTRDTRKFPVFRIFFKNAEISLSIDTKSAENNPCDVSIYPSCVYRYKNIRVYRYKNIHVSYLLRKLF